MNGSCPIWGVSPRSVQPWMLPLDPKLKSEDTGVRDPGSEGHSGSATLFHTNGPMPRVLLVTVTKTEAVAVLEAFEAHTSYPWARTRWDGKTYYDLGQVGGPRIWMVQSEMGAVSPGAALLTIRNAIEVVKPAAVIMVGIAFGIDRAKRQLGDILVSRQIQSYEPQKKKPGRAIPRGDRVTAPTNLLDAFRSADMAWKGTPVHFGLILSGEKLIDDAEFLAELAAQEPEAIGGEMEGAGLYAACADARIDWILVKAICDWADGTKSDGAQPQAAQNAAQFVLHTLDQGLGAPTEPMRRVELVLDGDFQDFTTARREALLTTLSALLKIEPDRIRLLQVRAGSVVLTLELPVQGWSLLESLTRQNVQALWAAGVRSVQEQGGEVIRLSHLAV